MQLTGYYQQYSNHKQGYPTFAFRVEKFIQKDVQAIVELTKETPDQEKQEGDKHKSSASASSDSETSKMLPPASATTKKS
ncbi:MAG: hypothetical protein AAFY76_17240 [Cyanobacteria bacterium J06649_11]